MIDGIPICTHPASQTTPKLISDDSSGAIIAWRDYRNDGAGYEWDIYAQRIDSNGVALWAPNGVAVCCCPDDQDRYDIVSDGDGGAFICWNSKHITGNHDVYAQHITADGSFTYPSPWGKLICDIMWDYPQWLGIVSDGYGGAIIIWGDNRDDIEDTYAQRVDWNLGLLWHPSGVPICVASKEQSDYVAVSDYAGGAIIAWQDLRDEATKGYDIYAQKVDVNGNIQWGPTGVLVCDILETSPIWQTSPRLVSDGSGGAIIHWWDKRDFLTKGYDIYAQWVNHNGKRKWSPGGKVVCNEEHDQKPFMIVTDDKGGAIISWQDLRNDNGDIYTQRIDWSGNRQWDWPIGSGIFDGVPICKVNEDQINPAMVSDNAGGAVIGWQDKRWGNWDIYAQRIYSDGRVGPHHIADLDIQDEHGDLYMNTMLLFLGKRFTWPPGLYFTWGVFNLVNPDQIDNNVDLFDGPGNENLVNISATVTPFHDPFDNTVSNPTPIVGVPSTLNSGKAKRGVAGAFIWSGAPLDVTYRSEVTVTATGKHSTDNVSDKFHLAVRTETSGGPWKNVLWIVSEKEKNILHWNNSTTEVIGFNLYRSGSDASSFNKLNSSLLTGTSYTDDNVTPGTTYEYAIGLVFGDETEIPIGPLPVTSLTELPTSFVLFQNNPNPCREFTTINYQIPSTVNSFSQDL